MSESARETRNQSHMPGNAGELTNKIKKIALSNGWGAAEAYVDQIIVAIINASKEREQTAVATALNDVYAKLKELAWEDGLLTDPDIDDFAENMRDSIPPDAQSALDRYVGHKVREAETRLLDLILDSLKNYPNRGGDIEIMKEVERIIADKMAEAKREM